MKTLSSSSFELFLHDFDETSALDRSLFLLQFADESIDIQILRLRRHTFQSVHHTFRVDSVDISGEVERGMGLILSHSS